MARAFCIPGIIFLVAAFVLSFLTSISLPFLTGLDITRTHFGNGVIQSESQGMVEIRVSLPVDLVFKIYLILPCSP